MNRYLKFFAGIKFPEVIFSWMPLIYAFKFLFFYCVLFCSLDYLGTVTASLRKDMQQAISDDVRLDVVVKTLLYEELEEEEQTGDIDTIDISHVSFSFYTHSKISSIKFNKIIQYFRIDTYLLSGSL